MVNEGLLVLIWAVDAVAIVSVVWLLAHESQRRGSQSKNQSPPESGQARDPDSFEASAHQIGAQASPSQALTSGSTRGPISASTRA
jgi:hypothetical protein